MASQEHSSGKSDHSSSIARTVLILKKDVLLTSVVDMEMEKRESPIETSSSKELEKHYRGGGL